MLHVSRRGFLRAVTAGTVVSTWQPVGGAQAPAGWKIGGFTKPIQDLSFEDTAQFAADVGWDGIEVALRAGGHVLPERVDDDLPRLVAALGRRQQTVLVTATDIRGVDPVTERVLRASATSGIRFYRLGAYRYRAGVPLLQQLAEFRAQLKDLGALNRQLGVTGLVQNHSGNG